MSPDELAELARLAAAYLTARAAYANAHGTVADFTAAYAAYGAQLDAFRAATPIDVVAHLVALAQEKSELPGDVEVLLGRWAQAPTCSGGRADDALVQLSNATGKHLGTLTLGWFREHTSFAQWEAAIIDNQREDAAPSPAEARV